MPELGTGQGSRKSIAPGHGWAAPAGAAHAGIYKKRQADADACRPELS